MLYYFLSLITFNNTFLFNWATNCPPPVLEIRIGFIQYYNISYNSLEVIPRLLHATSL